MKTKIPVFFLLKCFSVFLFLASISSSCSPSRAGTPTGNLAYADFKVPSFSLSDVDGNTYDSERLKGKYVVLHFATTWCPFCNAEATHLEKMYQDYQNKGVEVMIIDVKEDKALVKKKLIDRFNLTFPVLFDDDGAVASSFAPMDVLPDLARDEVMLASNLLISPEGELLYFSLLDTANFDAELKELKSVLNELL